MGKAQPVCFGVGTVALLGIIEEIRVSIIYSTLIDRPLLLLKWQLLYALSQKLGCHFWWFRHPEFCG